MTQPNNVIEDSFAKFCVESRSISGSNLGGALRALARIMEQTQKAPLFPAGPS